MEHSGESDTVPQSDGGPVEEDSMANQSAGKEKSVKERDLQAQVRVKHKLLWQICVVARHALGIKSLAKALKIPASLHSPVWTGECQIWEYFTKFPFFISVLNYFKRSNIGYKKKQTNQKNLKIS